MRRTASVTWTSAAVTVFYLAVGTRLLLGTSNCKVSKVMSYFLKSSSDFELHLKLSGEIRSGGGLSMGEREEGGYTHQQHDRSNASCVCKVESLPVCSLIIIEEKRLGEGERQTMMDP